MSDLARERRLRRLAEKYGLRLEKSRARDPEAPGYGTWRIMEGDSDWLVFVSNEEDNESAGEYGMTLDDVERHLTMREEVEKRR